MTANRLCLSIDIGPIPESVTLAGAQRILDTARAEIMVDMSGAFTNRAAIKEAIFAMIDRVLDAVEAESGGAGGAG